MRTMHTKWCDEPNSQSHKGNERCSKYSCLMIEHSNRPTFSSHFLMKREMEHLDTVDFSIENALFYEIQTTEIIWTCTSTTISCVENVSKQITWWCCRCDWGCYFMIEFINSLSTLCAFICMYWILCILILKYRPICRNNSKFWCNHTGTTWRKLQVDKPRSQTKRVWCISLWNVLYSSQNFNLT